MYLATIPSFFLHGFMMLFPFLNIITILAMSPDLPGQNKTAPPKDRAADDRKPA